MDTKSKRIICISFLVFLVVFLILFLFWPRTSTEILKVQDDKISYLTCRINGDSELYPLFLNSSYDNVDYKIKVEFTNQIASSLNLTVSKQFDNANDAELFANMLQTNYNIYIGQRNISQDGLLPTYTFVDNTGKMVLSVNGEKFAYDNAPLLMLGNEVVSKKTITDFEEYLSKKNFLCDIAQ
ncbi:hypothetical protein IKG41_01445 [Candidatus Saccharibacteria bacterium]|nr:hypothetical protein [Candidatus Saccharibacteria bacterium]